MAQLYHGPPLLGRMGIPVEVPGLDTIVPQVPEGQLVVVESGADPAKSFFIRRLCLTALHQQHPVTFVTSRDREELKSLFAAEAGSSTTPPPRLDIHERDNLQQLDEFATGGGVLAIDSFSLLTLDIDATRLAPMLRSVRALCRQKLWTVLLGTDRGMFENRAEAVVAHMSDGVFQFHSREGPEGLVRFLRIPKWMEGRFFDRNIYYDFDGRRMVIDLRRRVL